ncbi:hypothetical protein OYE22_26020 [Streptomyces sp. 71268]|uniref:hypothetical protein n=1 Tax=Streptomyces sp. 71268 TaxID=3002640 RepID=UPI0023F7F3D5|nr:hypothetical protein [Streptomyces sp. 71268]WEV28249.1 hypothetical protein OYE22_26020 [Streptomyces sp. 71268]
MRQDATPDLPVHAAEPESFAELRADCARMAPRWSASGAAATAPPVGPAQLRGVRVPSASAHLVDGMADYGD